MSNGENRRERNDGASGEGSFHVEDRRRFDPATGESRHAGDDIPLPGGGVLHGDAPRAPEAEYPVGFAELVNPFVLMGLVGLGIIPAPESGQPEVNLASAKAAIDVLELLHDRTSGRLQPDEARLLEQALYQLKMQYVELRGQRG